ncbi:fimbria/pilus outer membrane usher protein [Sphingobium sp. BYY-5]|uniref:fimbria/pilus outer membrane usher protein n=1 Tax=Sphingobium sp. BYY-5 TaxID=2926400 RepID=UPI001FA7B447|nr:fimbria/pilus outer membrane usher protein [Sphingobium sp. BYY-5]MCI4590293.1 fimbria/pilus outer membrane usher protein [Sphingobium sp. BYY-5]
MAPCTAAVKYDDIPAAAASSDVAGAVTATPLQLEIVINGVPSGVIVPVQADGGHFHMTAGDLRALALPAEGDAATPIAVDQLPGVIVDYDIPNQRLKLQVPAHWLHNQQIGFGPRQNQGPARSSFGIMLNYDLYAVDGEGAPPSASLWTDLRAFGPAGLLSTTGVARTDGTGTSYRRYDTRWIRSDEASMTTYEVGDLVTRTLPWSGAIRLGGVQISRDFAVRPDVVTYPMPNFAGEAALPSSVDLFIDNHQAFGGQVQPGPFVMNTLPQINGAGQASIVVTDALGRQVSTTIPFYVASTLLRPGLTDYAVAAGAVRQHYGQRSFDYGELAASASIRHGLTDMLTIEGHGEASRDGAVAGIGTVFRISTLGVVNAAYSRSRHAGRDGAQIALGYQYQRRNFTFSVNHLQQDAGYFDLATLHRDRRRSMRLTSVSTSVALSRFGSFGLGYIDSRTRGEGGTRLLNASWSIPLRGATSLFASATRDLRAGDLTASLNVQIPLGGRRGTLSSNIVREQDGRYSSRIDYNRAAPTQGGLGWNAGLARLGNGDIYGNGDMTWRTRDAELRGGAYGSAGNVTGWFGASGSLIWMDDSLFTANRVADAFALVSTRGHAGVPVYYENQLVGRTDTSGHILIPWATAYYPGSYMIDPLELSDDMTADIVEQRVAVARGSGYLLDFPVRRMIAARMVLVDKAGTLLPVGAVARINGNSMAYVGWDGLVFAEDLGPHNDLTVDLPEGQRCRTSFTIDVNAGGIADMGTLTCQ